MCIGRRLTVSQAQGQEPPVIGTLHTLVAAFFGAAIEQDPEVAPIRDAKSPFDEYRAYPARLTRL